MAYITSAGLFLPGDPVPNDVMGDYLGDVNTRSRTLGKLVLRQNKIAQRYYARTREGEITHSNAAMAAGAVQDAVRHSELSLSDLDFLATATTQGDLLVPGHGSLVHAELKAPALEVASFQSVCASSLMAAQMAYLQVKAGAKKAAVAVGSESSSRWFQKGFYDQADAFMADKHGQMDAEFLRWTLSDGAGAVLVEPEPNAHKPSLKIEWIDMISLADRFDLCMYAGVNRETRHDLDKVWSQYSSPVEATRAGAIMLLQDFALLKRILRAWVGRYLDLVDQGKIVPAEIDWLLCHYSAHSLREDIISLLEKTDAMIDEDKWFTNLATKGNTGAASIFIMLEELLHQQNLQKGQRILCIVPESGRAMIGFMMLTVV